MTIEDVVAKFLAEAEGAAVNLRSNGIKLISRDADGDARSGGRDFVLAEWLPEQNSLIVQYVSLRVSDAYKLSKRTRLHVAELHRQLAKKQMSFSYVTGLNGKIFEIVLDI